MLYIFYKIRKKALKKDKFYKKKFLKGEEKSAFRVMGGERNQHPGIIYTPVFIGKGV